MRKVKNFKVFLFVALLVIIVFLIDFTAWKNALSLVSERATGPAVKWVKEYKYTPFWRTSGIKSIILRRVDNDKYFQSEIKLHMSFDDIDLKMGNGKRIYTGLGENYGSWERSDFEDRQFFGDACVIYVHEERTPDTQGRLLLIIFGSKRFYIKEFQVRVEEERKGLTTYSWP